MSKEKSHAIVAKLKLAYYLWGGKVGSFSAGFAERTLVKNPKSRRRVGEYPRVSIDLPLEYREMFDSHLRTGVIGNLSDMGLLFCCRHGMSMATTLRIRVMFTDGYILAGFEAIAKIAWKDLSIKGDYFKYKYGAEFTYISEENREKLNQLLRHSLEAFLENQKEALPNLAVP